MRCKTLVTATAAILYVTLIAGCSSLKKVVYRPDINQGNYLSAEDVSKIQRGMTQQQVTDTLGTPMMQDPFGDKTWFYIFRQQPGRGKITQQTLTLIFDKNGTLSDIKNESIVAKNGG